MSWAHPDTTKFVTPYSDDGRQMTVYDRMLNERARRQRWLGQDARFGGALLLLASFVVWRWVSPSVGFGYSDHPFSQWAEMMALALAVFGVKKMVDYYRGEGWERGYYEGLRDTLFHFAHVNRDESENLDM